MSDLTFQMLLQCHYTGDKNKVDELHIEHLVDDKWQQLELNTLSPGFDIFMYSIINCQHMFFIKNAAEYGLQMNSSEGLITVLTNEHRSINTLIVEFNGKLKAGKVTDAEKKSIVARMELCPVSINLKDIPNYKTKVIFEAA